MKVSARIAETLVAHGVDTVFGLVGEGNLPIVQSLVHDLGLKYVSAAHEAAAVCMADGYARMSGRLGVATVTHGPGLTNTVTALTEATRNRTPMLVLAADTDPADRANLQAIEQAEVVAPTGAGIESVRSVASAARDVAVAIRRAVVEQRPIVLNVRVDLADAEAEGEVVVLPVSRGLGARPDPAALDRAVGIIATARRPVVLAGRGAVGADARASLLRLAQRIDAPLATTLLGQGLFRGEPADLGIFGTLSSPVTTEIVLEADCVVAFGAGLNQFTTASGSLLSGKRVVLCDIEPQRLGRYGGVDVAVAGDAAEVADAMVAMLDEAEVKASGYWGPELERRLSTAADASSYDDLSTDETMDLRTFLARMEVLLPADRTVVIDAGRYMGEAMRRLTVPHPTDFVFTCNFGSIGLGTATAVGAAVARPDRPVVAVVGDGGFMMGGFGEFNAAVRHGVDLILLLCNDNSYGAEYTVLRQQDADRSLSVFDWPDFAPVATALGGTGITVRVASDLDRIPEILANRDRPVLIEVKLDPNAVPDVGH